MAKARRADQTTHNAAFLKAKKKIYATQRVCGICGRPVDFEKRYPDPLSPCIDHIIPISKGGHPSDIANLQLAHWACNRQKADLFGAVKDQGGMMANESSEPEYPLSRDWKHYKPDI